MNRATELKVPPKPEIMATSAILSLGPGLPASRLPREPERAQAVTLLGETCSRLREKRQKSQYQGSKTVDNAYHANVPIGKLGRHALNFIILHLARTPRGENRRLSASKRSFGS